MAKEYINGYDAPTFLIRDKVTHALIETVQISFAYKALKEYYEKNSTLWKWDDGSKSKIPHYLDYEWRLFWTDDIGKDDLFKMKKIEDADSQGKEIILIPHKDYPWRYFAVLVLDEKREIDLQPHFGGADSTHNKGFEMTLVNAESITEVNMIDPDFIPVYPTEYGFEF